MAVTTQETTEYTNQTANPVVVADSIDLGGRVNFANLTFTQSGAGDAGSSVALIELPPGKIRILGGLSRLFVSALGAARVMKIGYDAYTDQSGTSVAADDDALDASVDVSAKVDFALGTASKGTLQLDSRDGIVIRATVTGGTIPDAATIGGQIAYATN